MTFMAPFPDTFILVTRHWFFFLVLIVNYIIRHLLPLYSVYMARQFSEIFIQGVTADVFENLLDEVLPGLLRTFAFLHSRSSR